MTDFKFCPDCGEKRLENAAFCTQCGKSLAAPSSNYLYFTSIGALALTVIVYAVIRYGIEPKAAPVIPQDVVHAETEAPAAQHTHDDPPVLKALKEKARSGDAAALMDLAEAQLQQSQEDPHYLEEGAATLEKIVSGYPKHAYSLRLLGNVYYGLKESERAVATYERYLAEQPEDANVHTDLGTMYLALNQSEKAISQFEKALTIFPDFYNALFNTSIAYQHIGNQAKADEYKKLAQEVDQKYGKKLAPDPNLQRVPEGAPAVDLSSTEVAESSAGTQAAEPAASAADLVSEGRDYAPLESFFRVHPIIGPKMSSFRAEAGKGILVLNNFPMDNMPPMVRGQLETKINNMLTTLGDGFALDILDESTGRVMGTYHK